MSKENYLFWKASINYIKREGELEQEIERLNNDIKELLKENGNKEKVIIKQDNIIGKAIEYIKQIRIQHIDQPYDNVLLNILQRGDKECHILFGKNM